MLPEDILYLASYFREQIDKLDVRRKQQCSSHRRAQMILQDIDLQYICTDLRTCSAHFLRMEKYLLWNVVVETGQLGKTVGHQLWDYQTPQVCNHRLWPCFHGRQVLEVPAMHSIYVERPMILPKGKNDMFYLKDGFRSVTLNIISINNDLNDAIPNFFGDVIACYPNQI